MNPKTNQECGFRLIELLVVIAVIAILAGMLLPTLSKAKSKAQSLKCVNNLKELQLAWHLYINDCDDFLPPHIVGAAPNGLTKALPGSWVVGNAQTDTTTTNIKSGVLYDYIGDPVVYRCPSDQSGVRGRPNAPRTRSYSIDSWLNDDPSRMGVPLESLQPYRKTKYTQLTNPSQVFVFIEEHEQCIDDGVFTAPHPLAFPQNRNSWWDVPAAGIIRSVQFRLPMVMCSPGLGNSPKLSRVIPSLQLSSLKTRSKVI